jgi:hypothetical protein
VRDIAHTHEDGNADVGHLHRLGNLPHDHGPAGNVIFKGSPQPITSDPDQTLVVGNAGVLPAVPPPDGGQAADPDPPVTPSVGDALEPSGTSSAVPAGSGDSGQGRPPRDAREAVLGAAMGVINPVFDAAADPAFQIRHAEESARVLIIGQHVGNMFQAIADKRFVANADLRAAYRKLRQIADFHGIDLDDDGVDR